MNRFRNIWKLNNTILNNQWAQLQRKLENTWN